MVPANSGPAFWPAPQRTALADQQGLLAGASHHARHAQAVETPPPLPVPLLPVPAWHTAAPEAEAAACAAAAAGIKREREDPEERVSTDLYNLEEASKEIFAPTLELVTELAHQMGQVNLDEDSASEPYASPRPQSPGSLYRRSLRPGAGGARTPAEGDPFSAALAHAPAPLLPRLAAEDEAALAMDAVEAASAALRRALAARAIGAAGPNFTDEPRLALFRALLHPALLDSPAYRSLRGRARHKRHLAILRSAGDSGARMARRAVELTAEALLAPLPGPDPDPAPGVPADPGWRPPSSAEWTLEAAELLVDRMRSFVWATTSEVSRVANDLFPLTWAYAERFLLRLGELSLPFLEKPGALHAKCLCLTADILTQFDRPKEAIAAYFEAWAELRKRALTPSQVESNVVHNLATLLFRDFQVQTALAVMEKWSVVAGERDEELFAAARLEHLQASFQVWRRDYAGALASCERSLHCMSELGPELSFMHSLGHLLPGMVSLFRVNIFGFQQYFTKAIEGLAALRDPAAPELDIAAPFLFGLNGLAHERNYIFGISFLCGLISKVDKKTETPMLAHAQFHLACMLMRVGNLRKAADMFRKAANWYANPKFAHLFPPDCPRVRRIAELMNQISSGQAAKAARAPGEDRKGNFFQRYFLAAFGGGKRSRVGPSADVPLSTPR